MKAKLLQQPTLKATLHGGLFIQGNLEMQLIDGNIGWRVKGGQERYKLIAISDLKGADGESIKGDRGYTPIKGIDYEDGKDGIGKDGKDGVKGDKGDTGESAYDLWKKDNKGKTIEDFWSWVRRDGERLIMGGSYMGIGTIIQGAGAGGVLFTDGSSGLQQDNSNLNFNNTTHRLSVGTAGDLTGTDTINIYGQYDAYLPNSSIGAVNSTSIPGITATSSRGTGASPIISNTGDLLGNHGFWGYTGSTPAYTNMAGIVGSAVGATASNLGGQLYFYTKADNASTYTSRMTIDNTGKVGIGTTAPTHTITLPSTSTGIALYNTADQTTNLERVTGTWASNIFKLITGSGGTGTTRSMYLGVQGREQLQLNNASPYVKMIAGSSGGGTVLHNINYSSLTASSGNNTWLSLDGTVLHTGTAGRTGILINIIDSGSGSGAKRLISAQLASVDKFYVDNAGRMGFDATMTAGGVTTPQTINKPTGSVNFAAAATTLVVTNSLVKTASIITCVVMTGDTTAYIKNVVPAAGSFTITLGAAATAETKVGFIVHN